MQGFESAQLHTYAIYKLLEHTKGLFLQIQNYKIFVTQGNNRISKRSPSEVSVLIEYQKSESSYQIK